MLQPARVEIWRSLLQCAVLALPLRFGVNDRCCGRVICDNITQPGLRYRYARGCGPAGIQRCAHLARL